MPIAAEFRVNTEVANTQTFPTVAVDYNGDFVIAWQSSLQDGSGYGIYSQRYDAQLARLGGRVSPRAAAVVGGAP